MGKGLFPGLVTLLGELATLQKQRMEVYSDAATSV